MQAVDILAIRHVTQQICGPKIILQILCLEEYSISICTKIIIASYD